jgi:hypothetical protein
MGVRIQGSATKETAAVPCKKKFLGHLRGWTILKGTQANADPCQGSPGKNHSRKKTNQGGRRPEGETERVSPHNHAATIGIKVVAPVGLHHWKSPQCFSIREYAKTSVGLVTSSWCFTQSGSLRYLRLGGPSQCGQGGLATCTPMQTRAFCKGVWRTCVTC